MRKNVLIISLVILLTGCMRVDNSNLDYVQLVENCLSSKISTTDVARGYKFYVPRGSLLIKNYDYNQEFLVDDVSLYLFVDIVSYYHKELNNDIKINDAYYYEKINYNGKSGFIYIKKDIDSYFVKIKYNYSYIEFKANDKNINKLIIMSSIILNNICYNDMIIETILDEDFNNGSNVTYKLVKPDESGSDFSHYLEEYVQNNEEEDTKSILPDE